MLYRFHKNNYYLLLVFRKLIHSILTVYNYYYMLKLRKRLLHFRRGDKMKRLSIIVFIISSLFFNILFQERSQENIDHLDIEDVLLEVTDKQLYEFSVFDADKETIKIFHNQLLNYVSVEGITVKTGYNQYIDDSSKIISHYLYNPDQTYFQYFKNHFEVIGKDIDFSQLDSDDYLSTDFSSKATSYFRLFNKNYLKNEKINYEIRCMNHFVDDYHAVNGNINYYVYLNNDENITYIENLLHSYFSLTQYATFDYTNEMISNEESSHYSIIFIVFIISFFICMIDLFYKKYKELSIVQLFGYRPFEIFRFYFLKECLICLFILISTLLFYFVIFVSRINSFTLIFLRK